MFPDRKQRKQSQHQAARGELIVSVYKSREIKLGSSLHGRMNQ